MYFLCYRVATSVLETSSRFIKVQVFFFLSKIKFKVKNVIYYIKILKRQGSPTRTTKIPNK